MSSVTSSKAAIILIYKYITWVFVLSCTQLNSVRHAVHKSYPCTDMNIQPCCCLLWCAAMWIQRILFYSHDPWRHQWRRVLFQFWTPLRSREDIGWCVRIEWAQDYTFIFTCNHFSSTVHPSLMPPLPLLLPFSMNWFSRIPLHTCPLVWLYSYLSNTHIETHTVYQLLPSIFSHLPRPYSHIHKHTQTQ